MRAIALALVTTLTFVLAESHAAPPPPIRVLVTNDDGVAAPGIDVLVQELTANPNLIVTVIAPATNQSGTGDRLTAGPIDITTSSTAGAFPARAVAGFPADTTVFGILTGMNPPPDLVVSGINQGQNIGDLTTLSGTVGAALWAARLGIPAIAVSQGFGVSLNYTDAAQFTARLVEKFRTSRGFRAKLTTRFGTRAALVLNVNFPTCTAGSRRGLQLVPLGRLSRTTGYTLQSTMGSTQRWAPITQGSSLASDCTSTAVDPITDVEAMAIGYATITPLNTDLTTSQKLRSFRFLLRP